MKAFDSTPMPKTERITKLVADLFAKMPEIEASRAELITESFRSTEGLPVVTRKAIAFRHILQKWS